MGKDTGIQWAHHTFNPWRGCSKVSPGCDLCYAEAMSRRNPSVLGIWGDDGTRPLAAESYWRSPLRWNRASQLAEENHRVFCGSLCDVFEPREDVQSARLRLLMLAYETTYLNWLFLTKRPQHIGACLRLAEHARYPFTDWWTLQGEQPRRNWWFGTTVEDMVRARERIPVLMSIPAAVRFLSCEPLLEPLNLLSWLETGQIHWVIVGGESNQGGVKARRLDLSWVEEIVGQCKRAGVACFVKQMGSRPLAEGVGLILKDRHGGDPEEWPDWMRVRELPEVRIA